MLLKKYRIKQLKQNQDEQFKRFTIARLFPRHPRKPKNLCKFLFSNPLAHPPPPMQAYCL